MGVIFFGSSIITTKKCVEILMFFFLETFRDKQVFKLWWCSLWRISRFLSVFSKTGILWILIFAIFHPHSLYFRKNKAVWRAPITKLQGPSGQLCFMYVCIFILLTNSFVPFNWLFYYIIIGYVYPDISNLRAIHFLS